MEKDFRTALISALTPILGKIVSDIPGLFQKIIDAAIRLENESHLTGREKLETLKKKIIEEIPTARKYIVNLIAELAVGIMHQENNQTWAELVERIDGKKSPFF